MSLQSPDQIYQLVPAKIYDDSNSHPAVDSNEHADLANRLNQILQRVLHARVHVRDYTCTVQELLKSPQNRKRVIQEIIELVREIYQAINENAQKRYDAFFTHPNFHAAVKFREDYINLKIINILFKFANAAAKLVSEPTSKMIKHTGSIFKITKKISNFRELDFRKITVSNLLTNDVLHEIFKTGFYALKIPSNIIDFVNNNPYLLMAYEAAGLGETYKPFTGLIVEFFSAVSPVITVLKVTSQLWAIKNATHEFRHIKPGNRDEFNKKLLILIKTVATLATETLKISIKLSLVSSTGILCVVVIPLSSCTIAMLAIWIVYKNVHQADKAKHPAIEIMAQASRDIALTA